MTEIVQDAEKRKMLHLGSNVTLYVQKRYAIIYLNFRIVVKMHKKTEKKLCRINEKSKTHLTSSTLEVIR